MSKKFIDKPFSYHEELVVTIKNVTNEGRGIANVDGWVVMVPFVMTGEVVKIRIFKNNKNYSEADLIEVIEPSKNRIEPRCKLFGKCGGCQYQHMSYDSQLNYKRQHVQDCFDRIAKTDVIVSDVVPSEKIYEYRTKLTPHFEKNRNGELPIGFLSYGKRKELVDVDRCEIASYNINKALPIEREKVKQAQNQKAGTLLLRDSMHGVITKNNQLAENLVGDLKFKFPAGSFFQNNPYVLDSIISHLQQIIGNTSDIHHIVDAYCGVGVFGIALAKKVKSFIGIEIDEQSVALALENMRSNNIDNGEVVLGEADTVFSKLSVNNNHTMLIMDPPRKGCSESFLDQLSQFCPKIIVYISCAPDTQARDAKRFLALNQNYKIMSLTPFDMFPQTRHVESILVFCCEK